MSFLKKKNDSDSANGDAGGSKDGEIRFSPQKAAAFFDRAQTVHDAHNFEFAMSLWLQGLGQDPGNMPGLEGFFRSAAAFLSNGGKKASRDTVRLVSGRGDVSKYLLSLLEWGLKPRDPHRAVRATELASRFGLREPALWLGRQALGVLADEKKPPKTLAVALLEIFAKFEEFDMAVRAGQIAEAADPTDARLSARVKNLSAEWTTARGGFDETGQEGGFRRNIRDLEKQQALEDQSRFVQTEQTAARIIERAKAEYEERPDDKTSIQRYVKALLDRGEPADEARALELLADSHRRFDEYRWKELADKVRLRQLTREHRRLRKAAEADPSDESACEAAEEAERALDEMTVEACEGQVKAYPTDLVKKFDLGKAYFKVGRHEEAISMFQEAKGDAKRRSAALSYLGQSFQQIDWHDAAVETFRTALESHESSDDATAMDLRYGLMTSLQAHAVDQRDLSIAEEAYKIASSIAMQDFNFKDIRQRRDELKKLVDELKTSV